MVGYQKTVLDDNFLSEYYKELSLNSTSYLTNILQLNKFAFKINLGRLMKKRTREGLIPAFILNAFYHPAINTINFPAAFLQSLFSEDQPMYLNYRTLGFIIGHELGHAFDASGSQLDEQGMYNQLQNFKKQNLHHLHYFTCFTSLPLPHLHYFSCTKSLVLLH